MKFSTVFFVVLLALFIFGAIYIANGAISEPQTTVVKTIPYTQ